MLVIVIFFKRKVPAGSPMCPLWPRCFRRDHDGRPIGHEGNTAITTKQLTYRTLIERGVRQVHHMPTDNAHHTLRPMPLMPEPWVR